MPIGAVLGVGSALIGASSASKAAKAQTAAADKQAEIERETRDIIRADLAPYRGAGDNALAAYQYELGLGEKPTFGGTEYGGFTKTPGYDFRLQQGTDAVEASRAAGSGLMSGRTLRDLTQYGQDYASNEYNNYLTRLGGMSDTGLSAAQMAGAASQNAAAGISQAYGNAGNAQAAGAIGVGNALTNGMNTGLGIYQYQQGLTQPYSSGIAGSGIW